MDQRWKKVNPFVCGIQKIKVNPKHINYIKRQDCDYEIPLNWGNSDKKETMGQSIRQTL